MTSRGQQTWPSKVPIKLPVIRSQQTPLMPLPTYVVRNLLSHRTSKNPPVGDVTLALRSLDASLALLTTCIIDTEVKGLKLCKRLRAFTLQETFILFPTPFHHVNGLGPGHLPQNFQIGDPKTRGRVFGLKETSVAAVEIGFPDSRARLRIPLIADAARPSNKRSRWCETASTGQ